MKYSVKQEKQILGDFCYHEQLDQAARGDQQEIDKLEKKVLILHTGGTIGMFRDCEGKFCPVKDKFKHFLQNYPYFCDEDETYFNSKDGFAITPPSVYKKKIWYKFRQIDKLIDSTNSNLDKLNEILFEIEKDYENYDAFVILHGTDTMAYTTSSLSFMIENLKKTIVVTGAQVPMGQVRNDSINNLLCALTIAGHFVIPEVLLVFDNKILRGNRATKTSASKFHSFKSPNFMPLGYLNLKINIHWEMIHHCKRDQATKFIPLKYEVETMKITPFSTPTIPKSKYIVLQSLGTGNVPTQGPYSEWLKQNARLPKQQQKVIVNISQVYQSVILNLYATGNQAMKLGLIPGSDMTCEAAMAKLSYLASKGFTEVDQLKELMMTNLRDELTETKDRLMTTKTNYVLRCMTILDKNFAKQSTDYQNLLIHIVYPLLLGQRVSKSTVDRLDQYEFKALYVYSDGGNILHYYSKMKSLNDHQEIFLQFLLDKGVDINLKDDEGNSPMFYALLTGKYQEAEILKQAGGKLFTTAKRVFQAVRNQELSLLHALAKFGDKFQYRNCEGRNLAMYSVINGKKDVATFLNDFTDLFQDENLEEKDAYGHDLNFYMEKFKFNLE